jgi:hypothetical protein
MLQNAVQSLIGMTLVGLVLLVASSVLAGRVRTAYGAGLAAAVFAYLVSMATAILSASLENARTILVIALAPAIEEIIRVAFVSTLLSALLKGGRVWPAALAFGFGYGLFESVGKQADQLIILSHGRPVGHAQLATLLIGPVIVLLLHVFLSVTAFLLAVRRWRAFAVLGVTFVLHAAHNASALLSPSLFSDFETLLLGHLVRVIIFCVLIAACLVGLRTPREPRRASEPSEARVG